MKRTDLTPGPFPPRNDSEGLRSACPTREGEKNTRRAAPAREGERGDGNTTTALRERDGTLYIALRVTPRAGRESLALAEDALCVRVAAAPVAGAANEAVIALLAKRLRLPKQAVTLVRGASGRQKLVAIAGMSAAEFRARMGL